MLLAVIFITVLFLKILSFSYGGLFPLCQTYLTCDYIFMRTANVMVGRVIKIIDKFIAII